MHFNIEELLGGITCLLQGFTMSVDTLLPQATSDKNNNALARHAGVLYDDRNTWYKARA